MKKFFKVCEEDGAIEGWVAFIVAIGLMIYSIICPPQGVLDGSVLLGVSELLAFTVVFKIPNMIKSIKDGKSIKIHHNDTEIEVNSDKDCECKKDGNTTIN